MARPARFSSLSRMYSWIGTLQSKIVVTLDLFSESIEGSKRFSDAVLSLSVYAGSRIAQKALCWGRVAAFPQREAEGLEVQRRHSASGEEFGAFGFGPFAAVALRPFLSFRCGGTPLSGELGAHAGPGFREFVAFGQCGGGGLHGGHGARGLAPLPRGAAPGQALAAVRAARDRHRSQCRALDAGFRLAP